MKTIKLSKGKVTLIDDSDYLKVSQYKWYFVMKNRSRYGYAVRDFGEHKVTLHRFLLNAPNNMQVDHVNGNGLDNRRINLRLCTQIENNRNNHKPKNNKSGYKGVSWHFGAKKWRATTAVNRKQIHLGFF